MDFSYYSTDGVPVSWYEKLIARNFLVSDTAVIILSIVLMIILTRKKQWNWKVFWIVSIPSIASGLFTGAVIYFIDPQFPGWVVLPWSSAGWAGFWCVEDILFYTFVTILFYGIYRLVHENRNWRDLKKAQEIKLAFFIFLSAASIAMLLFGGICGKIETLMYAVPALFLMLYSWNNINSGRMLIFLGLMVAFETFWDLFAVSWIYYYKSWAPGWIYITYDPEGTARFSRVFLDPQKHKWAWIFNNPIDITPWYGIVGASFIYMAINAAETYLVRRKYAQ